ncbi:MAG: cytidylate kinase-like family protein [Myxococcaceae bacterium]|nr:cytidylate kinase-like family protein [Myxococcaceae bacterium]
MSRPFHVLVPGVAPRLQAWEDIQSRLHQETTVKPRATVTLSRSFGCEGFPIAERVKLALEQASGEPWNIYDKTLLEAVEKEEGVSARVMQNLGLTASRFERLGLAPKEYYEQVRGFDAMARHIVSIAGGGNAIIVGRGGAVLCQAMKNCFHFRVDAPFDWRVDSIAKRLQMPVRADAEEFVRANSQRRDEFVKSMLKADPTAPMLYDAVFNNARHGVDEISAAIIAYVQAGWSFADAAPTP